MMKNYKMWIDGRGVDAISGKTFAVLNPATEETIANVPLGDKADVDMAVAAAQKAFKIWSKKSTEERSIILKELASIIRKHTKELFEVEILDHGSPISLANFCVGAVPRMLEAAAEQSKPLMNGGEINVMPGLIPFLKREPIGIVACIVPWNMPLMVMGKISAALATGNTCVVKPPSVDTLGALQLAEMMAEHPDLPPGAVNVVTGPGGTVGQAVATHPGIGMISFTGSSETGKALMVSASQTVKRLFLELGGKNPFIVLEDADLDECVAGAVDSLSGIPA